MADLKIFRLVDGSLIVGYQNFSVIEKALKLEFIADEHGVSYLLASLLFPFEEKSEPRNISAGHVVTSMDCPKGVRNTYIQETTGIIPVTTL